MAKRQPLNILLVASVSAIAHGTLALIFAPLMATIFLVAGFAPVQFAPLFSDGRGMVWAVAMPFIWAAMGFVAAAAVAFLYNLSAIDASMDEEVLVAPQYLHALRRAA